MSYTRGRIVYTTDPFTEKRPTREIPASHFRENNKFGSGYTKSSAGNSHFQIRNTQSHIRNSLFQIRNTQSQIRNTFSQTRNTQSQTVTNLSQAINLAWASIPVSDCIARAGAVLNACKASADVLRPAQD